MADSGGSADRDSVPADSDVGDHDIAPARTQGLIPRWAVITLVMLSLLIGASLVFDSFVVSILLSRVIKLQHDTCNLHEEVRRWEAVATMKLHIRPSFLRVLSCPR